MEFGYLCQELMNACLGVPLFLGDQEPADRAWNTNIYCLHSSVVPTVERIFSANESRLQLRHKQCSTQPLLCYSREQTIIYRACLYQLWFIIAPSQYFQLLSKPKMNVALANMNAYVVHTQA